MVKVSRFSKGDSVPKVMQRHTCSECRHSVFGKDVRGDTQLECANPKSMSHGGRVYQQQPECSVFAMKGQG